MRRAVLGAGQTGVLVVALGLVACRGEPDGGATGSTASATASASTLASATASASTSAAPRDGGDGGEVRTHGGVTGRIAPNRPRYLQAEPMFVRIEVTSASDTPLSFDDSARHYDWRVRDASGAAVCERTGGPGRLGSEHIGKVQLARGETFRDTLLLNRLCGKPLAPGRYVVTLLRALVAGWAPISKRGCEARGSPAGEGGAEDGGALEEAACIAADFPVEILPWDASALRARVAGLSAERKAAWEAKDYPLEGAITSYGYWFCDYVRCDCAPTWDRYGEWLAKAMTRVPDALPESCRKR